MNLVYFSPVSWNSFQQRPHRFVNWFHRKFLGKVLWIEPYPTRFPHIRDIMIFKRRLNEINPKNINRIPSWLTINRPSALPIEPLPCSGLLNALIWRKSTIEINHFIKNDETLIGIGRPSNMAVQVLKNNRAVTSFYDAMDDFSNFYKGLSRFSMATKEKLITEMVSKISVSSSNLTKRFVTLRHKLTFIPNGCATEKLPAIGNIIRNSKRPVLGYVGTIGHWFDWDLTISLATCNPNAIVRLIGPISCYPSVRLPGNIELLNACDHDTAIRSMLNFNVGLIPFKIIKLTESVDPIKYYEYRSLGLPIISSRFGEMAQRGDQPGVCLVSDNSNLKKTVQIAMDFFPNEDEINKFRKENSWESRFTSSGFLL